MGGEEQQKADRAQGARGAGGEEQAGQRKQPPGEEDSLAPPADRGSRHQRQAAVLFVATLTIRRCVLPSVILILCHFGFVL